MRYSILSVLPSTHSIILKPEERMLFKDLAFFWSMTFPNEKKLYLQKQDKSKKGGIDENVLPILKLINAHDDYYTTSSCSGRVYLWRGSGKKNETEWLRVSHELIGEDFFELEAGRAPISERYNKISRWSAEGDAPSGEAPHSENNPKSEAVLSPLQKAEVLPYK